MLHPLNAPFYPEIYLPDGYKKALSIEKSKPVPPTKPERRTPSDSFGGCLVFGVLLLVVYLTFLVTSSASESFGVGAVVAVIVAIIGWALYKKHFDNSQERKEIEEEYAAAMRQYDDDYQKYMVLLAEYEESESADEETRRDYILKNLKRFIDGYEAPEYYYNPFPETVHKGPAEEFLKKYISENSSEFDIEEDSMVPLNDTSPIDLSKDNCYFPDITLRHKKSGLMVDVEIDEPYEASTGKAIHYGMKSSYGSISSIDYIRNTAFTDRNWLVVRFTEREAFTDPKICTACLALVCSSISAGHTIEVALKDGFEEEKWTKEEAVEMAKANFRKTYIPSDTANIRTLPTATVLSTNQEYNDDLPF